MRQDLPIPVVVPSHYLGLGCGFSPRFVRVSGSFFDGERARTLELTGSSRDERRRAACDVSRAEIMITVKPLWAKVVVYRKASGVPEKGTVAVRFSELFGGPIKKQLTQHVTESPRMGHYPLDLRGNPHGRLESQMCSQT